MTALCPVIYDFSGESRNELVLEDGDIHASRVSCVWGLSGGSRGCSDVCSHTTTEAGRAAPFALSGRAHDPHLSAEGWGCGLGVAVPAQSRGARMAA